jgi:Peptidase family M23
VPGFGVDRARRENGMTFVGQHESGEFVSAFGESVRSGGRLFGFARSTRVWWVGALVGGFWLGCVAVGVVAAVTQNVGTRSGGAARFAVLSVRIVSPRPGGLYGLLSRGIARFNCGEGGSTAPIAMCTGTAANGHAIDTATPGAKTFTVTATGTAGNTMTKSVHYTVLGYTDPLRAVRGLHRLRIDQGVDYAGSGAILALGEGRVTMAKDHDPGWLDGGVVVYRLSRGLFAGKYVYVSENITVSVKAGQTVRAGEKIATLHDAYPNLETGWAAGKRDKTLADVDKHRCIPCSDVGDWSTIEGRNFDHLLVVLGAPSGYLQPHPPKQHMPKGWPSLTAPSTAAGTSGSRTELQEG